MGRDVERAGRRGSLPPWDETDENLFCKDLFGVEELAANIAVNPREGWPRDLNLKAYSRGERTSPTVTGGLWKAWTDGSVSPNPGRGGWSAIVVAPDGTRRELTGAEPRTTSSRAELSGIKIAVEAIPPGATATIYSDSQYAVRVLSGRYRAKKNKDLIHSVRQAAEGRSIEYRWLRGHAGHALNEQADYLAGRARIGLM